MTLVTVWHLSRHVGEGENRRLVEEFNHIEDGHVETDVPKAVTAQQQKNWAGGLWRREYATLAPRSVAYHTLDRKGRAQMVTMEIPSVVRRSAHEDVQAVVE
jgi:hypothetical protein